MDKKAETPEYRTQEEHRAHLKQIADRVLKEYAKSPQFDAIASAFAQGAEWQSQRMFTREDMQKAWGAGWAGGRGGEPDDFDQFMEDNYPEKPKG